MSRQPIPYARQWIRKEDTDRVLATLTSEFLTTGPEVRAFEEALCRVTGARHAVACSNGTAALHLACMALGVSSGDLGLTSPNSFLASANCIEFCGGRTDFIDIDPASLCMDPAALADYCRTRAVPRVVIPVDFAGTPADLPAIRALAEKFGFAVIEDAAHSLGSVYRHDGKTVACGSCTHTDLAIFSFHPAKTVTAGEGGAVMTNDEGLARRLRTLRTHGMVGSGDLPHETDGPWYYEMAELSYNYRITDIQCALGSAQLKHLETFRHRRREIVRMYNTAFESDHRLILPPAELAADACPHLYPIRFAGGNDVRKRIFLDLRDRDIFCQVHYIPIYWQPYYARKYGFTKGKCPRAETYYSQALSLPLFPALTDDEVHVVITTVKDVL